MPAHFEADVTINQGDIDGGMPCNCRLCPVAQAVERDCEAFGGVSVNIVAIQFTRYENGHKVHYAMPTPEEVCLFISDFDRRKEHKRGHVRPFTFRMLAYRN